MTQSDGHHIDAHNSNITVVGINSLGLNLSLTSQPPTLCLCLYFDMREGSAHGHHVQVLLIGEAAYEHSPIMLTHGSKLVRGVNVTLHVEDRSELIMNMHLTKMCAYFKHALISYSGYVMAVN